MAEAENDESAVRDISNAMSRIKLREDVLDEMRERGVKLDYVPETGNFAQKWSLAAPYHIFYTAIQKSQETWKHPLSVTFNEILDRSLGEIVQSLHLNFYVNFEWLGWQYSLAGQPLKMMVFYGSRADEEIKLPPTIEAHLIECPNEFGCHHPKVSILQYKDGGIRIIVSSANLFSEDWDVRTQGLWISPHLPRLDESAQSIDGESRTRFKSDFLSFLFVYGPRINQFKSIVQRADCSSINVVFFACVPGSYNIDNTNWGHKRLAKILKDHTVIPDNEPPTTIIAQASSIGCFGPNYGSWITTDLIASMSSTKKPKKPTPYLKCIFPTLENYKMSYDMEKLTNALGYNMERHKKQKWIIRYMHQWKADRIGCTHAMPHIKSFTRISADEKRVWWFVLGSSNFSKAAWGNVRGRTFSISNYEANVVFLPKFVIGENDFPIKEDSSRTTPIFPIHYDLPLTPYSDSDQPFVCDFIEEALELLNPPTNSEDGSNSETLNIK